MQLVKADVPAVLPSSHPPQDKALARSVQRLFASPDMRVNTTTGAPMQPLAAVGERRVVCRV